MKQFWLFEIVNEYTPDDRLEILSLFPIEIGLPTSNQLNVSLSAFDVSITNEPSAPPEQLGLVDITSI